MTAYARHTKFKSKYTDSKWFPMTHEGIPLTLEFSRHSLYRQEERRIYEGAIFYAIQKKLDDILDLPNDTRFIIIDSTLGISIVGAVHAQGTDLVVSVISLIHSSFPDNPNGTAVFAV